MAHSPARTGTVSVRLRRALVRIATRPAVRRLLVVAGLALAGWLFGGTAPASADATTPGHNVRVSSESPRRLQAPTAVRPDSLKGQPARAWPQELAGAARTGGFAKKARTAVREALATRPGLPVGMPGLGVLPAKAKQIVQDGRSTGKPADGASWAPGRRLSAVAISKAPRGEHAEGRRLGSPALHTYSASHADSAGSQSLPEADALLPAAGGAALGGASGGGFGGHLETGGLLPAFRPAFMPVLGNVSPAVRTAADEPSFLPD